jgi:WD40-like Beta Propeller Repeat
LSAGVTIVCGVPYPGNDKLKPEVCDVDTPITLEQVPTHDPAWDHDGTRLAFERDGTIYVRSVFLNEKQEGGVYAGQLRRLVAGRDPSWSPSGHELAFVRGSSGIRRIFVVRDNGDGAHGLTTGADDYAPAWSPDGKTIAYNRGSMLHLMRTNGSSDHELGRGRHAAWSADGKHIAFELDGDLWIENTAGGGRINVTKTPSLLETSPSWSPDGLAQIAFIGEDTASGERGVYTVAVGGRPVRRYVQALEATPILEPALDWHPVRLLVPTVALRKPIVSLRDARGAVLRTIRPGCYGVAYVDRSRRHGIFFYGVGFPFIGFNVLGPANTKSVAFVGRRWPRARGFGGNCAWLRVGVYRYRDPAHPRLRGTVRVVDRP